MMRKKTTIGFALTCVLVAAAIAFTVGYLIAGSKVKAVTEPTSGSSGYALVDEVEKIIEDNYLGTTNADELIRGMCKGYVEGLGDSAVKYLTADEYANYNKGTQGETIIYKNFGKGVGYMQFLGFSSTTKQSFTDAINDFKKSSISKVDMLVFDLRNCSTGDIETVAGLLDILLPEGETIAGIDKNGTRTVLYTSDQNELDYDIAILVNEKTSGVAEIFASTLNAYGKAVIVGTTTAGSCAKTDAVELSNGDYVLIPNMYYVTKNQQTYSSTGVVPSNVVEFSASEQKAFDSASLDISKDPQFIAAVKALGINDIATVPSSDTDSDKTSSDSDKDNTSSTTSSNTSSTSSNTSSTSSETESSEVLDPYWDDDEYWASETEDDDDNSQSNNGGNYGGSDDFRNSPEYTYEDGYYYGATGYYDEAGNYYSY